MSDFKVYSNIPRMMPSPTAPATANTGGSSFGNMLTEAIQQVNDVEKSSQGELQKFLSNESDLHSVMISLEKADLSFQTMMQVRNKIVSAYQEIMKAQV
ncbi:MAG TPA: flagellar hook-basal body complex protein FliE [Terriglobia bacterium]|nr:flagellar hook-basal body complex protein FliE [Terriglobia bacterium]